METSTSKHNQGSYVTFADHCAALEKDGFVLERKTQTGGHIYYHADGRITVVHYHKGSDTLTRKTLQSILDAVRWSKVDLKRLGLLK